MILIFSIQTDSSTCDIIDWLVSERIDFVRINMDNYNAINYLKFEVGNDENNFIIIYKNKKINLHDVKGVWYRKGGYLKLNQSINWAELSISNKAKQELKFDLWNEAKSITTFIHSYLKNKKSINSFFTSNPNKLLMLKEAVDCGLKVPKTLVTNSKSDLKKFIKEYGNVITKGIDESLHFGDDENFYSVYTEEVVDLETLPESFFMSKFQQKINKVFEIRVFYFFEKLYSMAIFSQGNEQTSTDFRKYDRQKPNRSVPYELPLKVKNKVIKLMDRMNLNCGSLDLIYNENEEFVFLEINPVGQFGMISTPCNYNLEKVIAEKLIDYEKSN
jgi:ATP-GRASP peptide maturase of grasp-with-spasm system